MGVDTSGVVDFGPADDDPVRAALDDAHELVGVGLLGRLLGAVALGVGHRAYDHEVLTLNVTEVLLEALVVRSAMGLVGLEGDGVDGVQSVQPDTALEAGAGRLAEQSQHLDLLHQVVGALKDVRVTVDAFARQVADRGHHVLVFEHVREFVGFSDGVDVRRDRRMVDDLLDELAVYVGTNVQCSQAVYVLLWGLQGHSGTFPIELVRRDP